MRNTSSRGESCPRCNTTGQANDTFVRFKKMDLLHGITGLFEKLENRLATYEEKTFRRFALLLYALFAAANIIAHEMWRDELNPWMIVDNSRTIGELFSNLRYDGHPPLWYLVLYALSRVTHNPVGMQTLHLAIAVTSAYIFLRFAPFTRLQRLMFIFGYYLLYEYAAISRNYTIEILLIFCFCVAFQSGGRKNYLLLAVILFGICLTNAYGFLIASCLVCMMGFELLTDRNTGRIIREERWTILIFILLVSAGLFISAKIMIPNSASAYTSWTKGYDAERYIKTLASVWNGVIPLPRIKISYWNRNIIPDEELRGLLSIPLICFMMFLFARKRIPLLLFGSSLCMILTFQYFKYLGFLRHSGHIYVMLIVCLWLDRDYNEDIEFKPGWLRNAVEFCLSRKIAFVTLLLVIHVIAGVHASAMEWLYPFSQAKNAAKYIEKHGLAKMPILGEVDHAASSVAGYLNRPIYYARGERTRSFIIYDKKGETAIAEPTLMARAYDFAKNEKGNVLLVLNHKLKEDYMSIEPLEKFTGSLQGDENFYLYLLKR